MSEPTAKHGVPRDGFIMPIRTQYHHHPILLPNQREWYPYEHTSDYIDVKSGAKWEQKQQAIYDN